MYQWPSLAQLKLAEESLATIRVATQGGAESKKSPESANTATSGVCIVMMSKLGCSRRWGAVLCTVDVVVS